MINLSVLKNDLKLFIRSRGLSIRDNLPLNFIIPKYDENFLDCLGYTLSLDATDKSRLLFVKIYSGNINSICKNKLTLKYNKKIIDDVFLALVNNLNNLKFIELERLVDLKTYGLIYSYLKEIDAEYKNLNMATTASLIDSGILNFNNISNFDTICMNSLKHALKKADYRLRIRRDNNGIIYPYIEDYEDIYSMEIPN